MAALNGLTKSFAEQHRIQLETSDVPPHFWPTLFTKLQTQIYDAGECFQLCQLTSTDDGSADGQLWQVIVIKEEGMKARDPENIFLIDHAWTYRSEDARNYLSEVPGLLERMVALMDIPNEDRTMQECTEKVLKEMWKFNMTYTLVGKTPEESLPVWYIMDEFGSRIQHCGEPSFRVVPFYYTPHQCCYSLLFPVEDVNEGDEVTRNFVETPPVDPATRDAQMLPWYPLAMSHVDPQQTEPTEDVFTAGRVNEILPEPDTTVENLPRDRPLRVYADYEYVRDYLNDPRFVITDCQEEADILWLSSHFLDFRSLSSIPHRRINQFPYEFILTVKDLLAIVCRRAAKTDDKEEERETKGPSWLPITFCLKRELAKLVSYFQRREERGEDNHWIVKPVNLARGLDHTITDDLHHILRLPSTGPKIAQKYISSPVLFHRDDIKADVKFDLRFIVMLLSIKPLKVAVYRRFWIRFANKAFDLSQLHNAQKHFTVNNYNNAFLLQMYCHDFIEKFNQQYPDDNWEKVEKEVYKMFFEVFKAATACDIPKGIPHNPQCKGAYGFDIMLNWTQEGENKTMQPQLLEVNFNSDCKRACEYYPEFFNDVFSVMFLDECDGHNVAILQ